MSLNDMPGAGPVGGSDRPSTPSRQAPAGRSMPGAQQNQANPGGAMGQLTKLLGQEFIALGQSILSEDPKKFAISSSKLRQIQTAAESLGQQPQQQNFPGDQKPQGPRTGVSPPSSPQPVDVHTRKPI